MATQDEYAAVTKALIPEIRADAGSEMDQAGYGFAKGMIPENLIDQLAVSVAKKAVDTIDAYRAARNQQK
jgi:hypothetical protein